MLPDGSRLHVVTPDITESARYALERPSRCPVIHGQASGGRRSAMGLDLEQVGALSVKIRIGEDGAGAARRDISGASTPIA